MQERNEISVELSAISALVGGISRQIPYRIPVGYFDQFPHTVARRLAAKSATFDVPRGYFDGLAAQVLGRIKAGGSNANVDQDMISAGYDELPPIFNQISRITPYKAPEGYWDELSPLLEILRDMPAYAVPEEFWDELSPVLIVAHEHATYRVPEGYLEALAGQILEKVGEPVTGRKIAERITDARVAEPITGTKVVEPIAPVRIIPMEPVVARSRENGRRGEGKVLKGNWWKYSSVASIAACLLLIFSWPQINNQKSEARETAMISQGLQKVTDQEMQTYLDDQHTLLSDPLDKSTATLDMNEGDVKSLLGDVSDNDLQQYMQEHGKTEDLATN